MMILARMRFDPSWGSGAAPLPFDVASLWFAEGGHSTIESYKVRYEGTGARWWEFIPEAHWQFVMATAMEHVTPLYHFVHAGLVPTGFDWPDDALQGDARLWIREPFLSNRACDYGGKLVVFGHTPQRSGQPLIHPNKIGIDTGAAYGGPLTAVALDVEAPKVVALYQA